MMDGQKNIKPFVHLRKMLWPSPGYFSETST